MLNFVKKINNESYYLFSISITKDAISKSMETFLECGSSQLGLSEKEVWEMRGKYKQIELSFKVCWRECVQQNLSLY